MTSVAVWEIRAYEIARAHIGKVLPQDAELIHVGNQLEATIAAAAVVDIILLALASYFVCQRHYPVNYNLKKTGGYLALSLGLFFIRESLTSKGIHLSLITNTIFLLVFVATVESDEPQIDLADAGGYIQVPDTFDEVYELSRTDLITMYKDVWRKQVYDCMVVIAVMSVVGNFPSMHGVALYAMLHTAMMNIMVDKF